jgi:regulator of CtrA degradation
LALFREGMDLVASAAAYLDGEGREQAKLLPRGAALSYVVESMRLTTRLMQVASWLLLQRAVNEGELSRAEAFAEKRRVRLTRQDAAVSGSASAGLPDRLCELVELSLRVQARIIHLDRLFYKTRETRAAGNAGASPVQGQIALLRAAFPEIRSSAM